MVRNKRLFLFLVFIFALAADIITKQLFRGANFAVLPGFFHITYVENTGAVWGILHNQNIVLIWVYLIVIGMLIYMHDYFEKNNTSLFAYSLVLAGAFGNLIDRICYSFVIDFLDFRIWPVFNLADSAVTAGVIIIAYLALSKKLQ